jgi:mannose-6-phosphate isomerase-like protein (cupin superfamily)
MNPINLSEKLLLFDALWTPHIVGTYNSNDLMVVKVQGEFQWHVHPETDDFFLVVKGCLTIRMRSGDVVLHAGEMFVVPKGVEHCPVAEEEAHILLMEPQGTPNTGDMTTAVVKRLL